MDISTIVILVFLILETSNVIMLYFTPSTKKGNAMGVFDTYKKAQKDPEIAALINYLVTWVAGTKLIFIALLIVILLFGDTTLRLYSLIALTITTSTFYWRLYPIIKSMDKKGWISPKGYSKTLAIMIGAFITIFIIAAAFSI